ncbi:MAG TPA: DnaJ domain-containing protein [Anaerolineae bacterium]|nr:DnaJ domain-containing protein [Anaerolineae bacterium]
MKDYYALLNIKPDASPAHIDAAYRRLMQKYHPNVRATPQALERMRDLHEAWRVLSDPTQRAAYDMARATGGLYQPPAAPPPPRTLPQSSIAEFGAGRPRGSTCLVGLGIVLVLVFALGVLIWGLNQQYNFAEALKQTENELNALLPVGLDATPVALSESTPTPDPRCRNGCETPPPGCVVKGDVEADGAHYFYLPNDDGYASVRVNVEAGDRWFCALNDAQSAGWQRKAPTPTPSPPPPPEALITTVPRRAYIVCGENAALHQGASDDSRIVQNVENGTRLTVTGVNGEWSIVNIEEGTAYIRTALLCVPTRVPPKPTDANAPTDAANIPIDAATATPLSAPIASAAANSFKYPAPQLVSPSNGSKYWCSRDLVLQWSLAAALGADEYFVVESKAADKTEWRALADWTKDTTVMLHPAKGSGSCDALWWGNTGAYEWRVSVVRGSHEAPERLSPFSETYNINYAH